MNLLSMAINVTLNFDLYFSLVFSRLRSLLYGGGAWSTVVLHLYTLDCFSATSVRLVSLEVGPSGER